jgi:hypothetical protein
VAWASGPQGRPPVGLLSAKKGTLTRGQRCGRGRPRNTEDEPSGDSALQAAGLRYRLATAWSDRAQALFQLARSRLIATPTAARRRRCRQLRIAITRGRLDSSIAMGALMRSLAAAIRIEQASPDDAATGPFPAPAKSPPKVRQPQGNRASLLLLLCVFDAVNVRHERVKHK